MIKIDASSSLGLPTILTKKRKYTSDSNFVTDQKRVKQDVSDTNLNVRRRVAQNVNKRKAADVLADVLMRLEAGDRQIASHLLREFSIDHLATVSRDLPEIVSLIITSATVTKYDQIASALLRMLLCVMRRADNSLWVLIMSRLLSDDGPEALLFGRISLDDRLLHLLTDGLNRGTVNAATLPVRVLRCSERSLRCSTNASRRSAAIGFQVARTINKRSDSTAFRQLERTLCQMTSDRDARVRIAAVDGLGVLSRREDALTIQTYNIVRNLIGDSDRHVRIEALRILLVFANRSPLCMVTSSHGRDNRLSLSDDSFSLICNAINDPEVTVRSEAATLLGQFTTVSDAFLDQTLDKKLMKSVKDSGGNEKVKKIQTSMFSISKNTNLPSVKKEGRWKNKWQKPGSVQQGSNSEWSCGKELNAPCPAADGPSVDEGESIISYGSCGAFVSALEDEFMSVRKAAVYSLGQLAAHRPSFATTALDHLADMFNDEIAEVRLDAIYALTPLVVHGQLQKEQLETILKCLDDAMPASRQALRELLAKGEFADVECMKLCARALINCLQRFPSDKNQIYQCLSELGARHGVFVHAMVRGLLDLHHIFDSQEQQIDDIYYTAKLILVLNAAARYSPVVSLLPQYVLKHYRFLRAAMPHYVAPIKCVDTNAVERLAYSNDSELEGSADILQNTYERLRDVYREVTLSDRNLLRRFIVDDAKAICSFNAPLAGSARFLVSLIEICSALESTSQIVLCGGDLTDAVYTIQQEIIRVHCAEHQFSGVSSPIASFLIESRLHLSLQAVMVSLMSNPEMYTQIIQDIRNIIDYANSRWVEIGAPSDMAISLMSEILSILNCEKDDEKKILTPGALGHLLTRYAPILPDSFPDIGGIRLKWAQITEPDKDAALEKPIRFVAGLPTAVPFAANLFNLDNGDIKKIRVQVDYPDHARTFFRPRISDFSGKQSSVMSKVLLTSPQAWSDSAEVRLTLVLITDSASGPVPVPLLDSPTRASNASVCVRMYPMNRS